MKTNFKDQTFGGMLGTTVSVKKVRGKMLVTNQAKRKAPKPTDELLTAQGKFQAAIQYAKRQIAISKSNALYATGITDKKRSAYMVALTDYLTPPKVNSINFRGYKGRVGDTLVVQAEDDFRVTKVIVRITDGKGVVLEEGQAGPDTHDINQWEYKATVANANLEGTTIFAEAYDRPGNVGELEVTL